MIGAGTADRYQQQNAAIEKFGFVCYRPLYLNLAGAGKCADRLGIVRGRNAGKAPGAEQQPENGERGEHTPAVASEQDNTEQGYGGADQEGG